MYTTGPSFFGTQDSTNPTYQIPRSLRLRSSASAVLTRTAGVSTNNKAYTFSAWVKRGLIGTGYLISAASPVNTNVQFGGIWFNNDALSVYEQNNVSTPNWYVTTSAVFKDTSAWYHIVVAVDTTQAVTLDRIKIYVNGVQLSYSTSNAPGLNATSYLNIGSNDMAIGRYNGNGLGLNFDGCLADINFIDGQALTPGDFGQTFAGWAAWTAKKYTGTYGANGFHLPFNITTNTTTLGTDTSGNSNNWTTANISLTAGVTYDSMYDVPLGAGGTIGNGLGNYPTLNPNNSYAGSVSNGGLHFVNASTANYNTAIASTPFSSGDWYAEVTIESISVTGTVQMGIISSSFTNGITLNKPIGWEINGYSYTNAGTRVGIGAQTFYYGVPCVAGDVITISVSWDAINNWFWVVFFINGSSMGTAWTPPAGSYVFGLSMAGAAVSINFGQQPFVYDLSGSGWKSLNTYQMAVPSIKTPNIYFDATTYTGTSASQPITNAGAFQPDLVWIKSRSAATDHKLTDSTRGATNAIISDSTAPQTTDAQGLQSFNVDGFTLGTNTVYNNNSATYVGWQWKKSATPGFDIQQYTGSGGSQAITHTLGVAPSMIIIKRTDAAGTSNWPVYSSSLVVTEYLLLNSVNAKVTGSSIWNSSAPNSTTFTVGPSSEVNATGGIYISYLFAPITGFSVSGSYVGNGSANGPFITCSFKPRFIMVKCATGAAPWMMYDTARDPINNASKFLRAETNSPEDAGAGDPINFLSNGIKITTGDSWLNTNTATYIYLVFADNPFKYALAQ